MTTIAPVRHIVLYYRICLACQLRYATRYPNAKCPVCHATGRTYGLKVDEKKEAPGGPEAS